MNTRMTRHTLAAVAVAASAALLAACGNTSTSNTMPGMNMSTTMTSPSTSATNSMPMAHGNGLSATDDGYTLTLKSAPIPGKSTPITFVIAKDGKPFTDYQVEQTKKLHFYLIRDDLTGFQHLHPTMAADGTWSVTPGSIAPGNYRIYTQFDPVGATDPYVLSVPVRAGVGSMHTLPGVGTTTTVGGYQVRLDGALTRGGRVKVSFTKDGKPVTDLQPYLDTYAHVTGFREGDMAFTHLHPGNAVTTMGGGPDLMFMIEAPEAGTYRLFIQFTVAGLLHTAALTTTIN